MAGSGGGPVKATWGIRCVYVPPAERNSFLQPNTREGEKSHHIRAICGLPRTCRRNGLCKSVKLRAGGQVEPLCSQLRAGDVNGRIEINDTAFAGDFKHGLEYLYALI